MAFDLRKYLELFPEVCRRKFGRTYDFDALEDYFRYVREGKRWLVAKHVEEIFSERRTPFARYWAAPESRALDATLSRVRLLLAPLPEPPDPLIQKLLGIFHNIGVVSLVLRFVHPERFGIFSTPVMNLIPLSATNAIELYVAFCNELREWQKHFRTDSVAQTEMALWTFSQVVREEASERALEARSEFDRDLWVQRRRVAFLLRPLLRNYGPLELARIILEEDANLAGKIAAEEYERLLRCASENLIGRPLRFKQGAAEALIEQMSREGRVSSSEKVDLLEIWRIRNKAVHSDQRPSPEEVEKMILLVERICTPWAGKKPGAGRKP